jgi:hypothetical protein
LKVVTEQELDIRLAVGFWDHYKTKALWNVLGPEGPISLQRLWCYARINRPDGALVGMDARKIAAAAHWTGDVRVFTRSLLQVGYLERNEHGTYVLHDWKLRNPYAAGAEFRVRRAKKAAHDRHHQGVKNADCEFCNEDAEALLDGATSNFEHATRATEHAPARGHAPHHSKPNQATPDPDLENEKKKKTPTTRVRRNGDQETEAIANGGPLPMTEAQFLFRTGEIAKWLQKAKARGVGPGEPNFDAEFEHEFQFTWTYWLAAKTRMTEALSQERRSE